MAHCEDFPCCGHELGCCPDYDEYGRQLNMKCSCGASVPLTSKYSICAGCLSDEADEMEDEDNNGYTTKDCGCSDDETCEDCEVDEEHARTCGCVGDEICDECEDDISESNGYDYEDEDD